jgi:hypothetical protein
MELAVADFEAWAEAMPTGVHPSLVHRLARPLDDPPRLLQSAPATVPASLRGPNYVED